MEPEKEPEPEPQPKAIWHCFSLLVAGNSSVKSFLFAFCRFRNKNPQRLESSLKSSSSSSSPCSTYVVARERERERESACFCLCAINLLTKEGLLLDHAAIPAASSLPLCLPAEQDASYILRRYCLRIS